MGSGSAVVCGGISDRGKTDLVFLDPDHKMGRGDPGRGLATQHISRKEHSIRERKNFIQKEGIISNFRAPW